MATALVVEAPTPTRTRAPTAASAGPELLPSGDRRRERHRPAHADQERDRRCQRPAGREEQAGDPDREVDRHEHEAGHLELLGGVERNLGRVEVREAVIDRIEDGPEEVQLPLAHMRHRNGHRVAHGR